MRDMITTLGIRREDKNEWERRVSIIPEHAGRLMQTAGLRIMVQPSALRVFQDHEYAQVGGVIKEELDDCEVILNVKEVPPEKILADKVYLLFSHTIKGQPHNLAMLRRFMEQRCTLIDYECITDDQGKRLVFFGRYAGLAGMLETLRGLGLRWRLQGQSTPLLELKPAYEYDSLESAESAVHSIGERISSHGGGPFRTAPVLFGFSGYGQVSRGAQEIFDLLPVRTLAPQELDAAVPYAGFYKTVFTEEDMVEPCRPGAVFSLNEYYQRPKNYCSRFQSYLPFLTVLVNGIYWDKRYPRLVSKKGLRELAQQGPLRLQIIGDISCDIHGSIECTERITTPENPFLTWQPLTGAWHIGLSTDGVSILAVDHLPAELPRAASIGFSQALWPLLSGLATVDLHAPLAQCGLPEPLQRATILHNGVLTSGFQYLQKHLQKED